MDDQELAERLISFTRRLQAEGADLQSLSAAWFGLAITVWSEQHGRESAAAHLHLLADQIGHATVESQH